MTNISNNPKGKMDKYLGMYREDDTVFNRFDRIWVEVKNDNATRTFRILDSVIII